MRLRSVSMARHSHDFSTTRHPREHFQTDGWTVGWAALFVVINRPVRRGQQGEDQKSSQHLPHRCECFEVKVVRANRQGWLANGNDAILQVAGSRLSLELLIGIGLLVVDVAEILVVRGGEVELFERVEGLFEGEEAGQDGVGLEEVGALDVSLAGAEVEVERERYCIGH